MPREWIEADVRGDRSRDGFLRLEALEQRIDAGPTRPLPLSSASRSSRRRSRPQGGCPTAARCCRPTPRRAPPRPLGRRARGHTPSWPLSCMISSPETASNSKIAPSRQPQSDAPAVAGEGDGVDDGRSLRRGCTPVGLTPPTGRSRTTLTCRISRPDERSQIRSVPSAPPVARRFPSGLKRDRRPRPTSRRRTVASVSASRISHVAALRSAGDPLLVGADGDRSNHVSVHVLPAPRRQRHRIQDLQLLLPLRRPRCSRAPARRRGATPLRRRTARSVR